MAKLDFVKKEISPVDYKRAKYILEENNRVEKMKNVLISGDAEKIGSLLLAGHNAMSTEYEITTEELDILVSIGESLPGVLGSRMMGGGFGGCTINLIKNEAIEESLEAIVNEYEKRTGITSEVVRLQIGNGVHMVS
jgi:galactokinase